MINGQEFSSIDGRITINTDYDGYFYIDAYIYDNLDAVDHQAISVLVQNNQRPVASMECRDTRNLSLLCESTSMDPDGHELTYEWTVNDETLNTKDIEYTVPYPQNVFVKLKVTDPFGLSDNTNNTSYDIDFPNVAPNATINCNSPGPFSVFCSGKGSTDSDGSVVRYDWYVDDKLFQSSGVEEFEGTSYPNLNPEVKLIIVDNDGGFDEKVISVETQAPQIFADFNCSQIDNYIAECISISRITHGEIEEYMWTVDGEVLGTEKDLTITAESIGEKNVILNVKSLAGNLEANSMSTISFVEIPNNQLPSKGRGSLNIDDSQLHPIGQNIVLTVADVLIASDINIYINENNISNELITFTDTEISFTGFVDGRNELEISFIDDAGQLFKEDYVFYAGTKSQTLELNNFAVNEFTLKIHLFDDQSYKTSQLVEESSIILENLPNQDLLIEVVNENKSRFAVINKTSSETKVLDFNSDTYPLNEDNLDFSSALEGWNLVEGNYEINNPSNIDFNQAYEGVDKLELTPSENGMIHLKSKFLVAGESTTLSIPFAFNSKNLNSIFVARLNNLTQSSSKIHYGYFKDLSSTKERNIFLENIATATNTNDELEVEFLGIFDQNEVVKKDYFNFFHSAYANTENRDTLDVFPPDKTGVIQILSFDLYDSTGIDKGRKVRNIPTGKFLNDFELITSYGLKSNMEFKIDFELSKNHIYKEQVLLCPQGIFTPEQCSSIDVRDYQNSGEKYISYPSNFTAINSNFLRVCLALYDDIDRKYVLSKCAKTDQSKVLFRNIINLTANSLISEQYRYGDRDEYLGEDSWVSYSHRKLFNDTLYASHWFEYYENNEKKRKLERINYDDFSGVSQSSRTEDKEKNELQHLGHNDGITVDARWVPDTAIYTSIIRGNTEKDVDNFQDAQAIESFLNHNDTSKYVKRILVSNKNLDNQISDFDSVDLFTAYVKSSCLNSGALLSDVLVNKVGHGNHLDIQFSDIDFEGDFDTRSTQYINIDENIKLIDNLFKTELKISLNNLIQNNLEVYYLPKFQDPLLSNLNVPLLVPLEEVEDHPIYIDGDTIKISKLFPNRERTDLFGRDLLQEIKFKFLYKSQDGCGQTEITKNILNYSDIQEAADKALNLNYNERVIYLLDKEKLDKNHMASIVSNKPREHTCNVLDNEGNVVSGCGNFKIGDYSGEGYFIYIRSLETTAFILSVDYFKTLKENIDSGMNNIYIGYDNIVKRNYMTIVGKESNTFRSVSFDDQLIYNEINGNSYSLITLDFKENVEIFITEKTNMNFYHDFKPIVMRIECDGYCTGFSGTRERGTLYFDKNHDSTFSKKEFSWLETAKQVGAYSNNEYLLLNKDNFFGYYLNDSRLSGNKYYRQCRNSDGDTEKTIMYSLVIGDIISDEENKNTNPTKLIDDSANKYEERCN